jgi:hypothetical protein
MPAAAPVAAPAAAPAARRAPRVPASAAASAKGSPKGKPKAEPKILFQSYFKSVGPRTYAAQVKEAGNGNHFLVLTEGKRDEGAGDVKKTRLFVFSEDFAAFFRLMKESAEFIKAHPVPDKVKQKREKFWSKQSADAAPQRGARPAAAPVAAAAAGAH